MIDTAGTGLTLHVSTKPMKGSWYYRLPYDSLILVNKTDSYIIMLFIPLS